MDPGLRRDDGVRSSFARREDRAQPIGRARNALQMRIAQTVVVDQSERAIDLAVPDQQPRPAFLSRSQRPLQRSFSGVNSRPLTAISVVLVVMPALNAGPFQRTSLIFESFVDTRIPIDVE